MAPGGVFRRHVGADASIARRRPLSPGFEQPVEGVWLCTASLRERNMYVQRYINDLLREEGHLTDIKKQHGSPQRSVSVRSNAASKDIGPAPLLNAPSASSINVLSRVASTRRISCAANRPGKRQTSRDWAARSLIVTVLGVTFASGNVQSSRLR